MTVTVTLEHQEGLPDYWGIETQVPAVPVRGSFRQYQEGLPDYWGIETVFPADMFDAESNPIRKDYPTTGVLKLRLKVVTFTPSNSLLSGRITRLLGY